MAPPKRASGAKTFGPTKDETAERSLVQVTDDRDIEEIRRRRSSVLPIFFLTTVSASSSLRAADFKEGDFKEQEALIRVLLQGYSAPKTHDRVDRRYWKDRSDDENIGRKALADAIRSGRPLSQYTRDLLAALFDSQDDKHPAIKRRIKFEDRRRGRKRNNFNDTLVANHIYETVRQGGASIEDGINSAMGQFELGYDRVKEIWRGYGPALKAIHGPLPRSPRKPNRVP